MPIVPTEFVQDVMPQGQLSYQHIHAKPDEFGAQLGPTLQKTGKMLEKNAISSQELINRANVNDVYATRFDPAARSIYEEYLSLGGKDAAMGLPAYRQKMQDLADNIREGLPNDLQQMRFDEMTRHRMQGNFDAMARHQASQTGQWVARTGDAMAQALSKRITDERYNFDYVAGPEGLIQGIKNMYASYDRVAGQDPAASELKATAAIDKGLSDAILNEARSNATGAKLLYDRYAPYMSSDPVRRHVLDNLAPAVRQEQNQAVYSDVLKRFDLLGLNSDVDAATKWVMDPNNYQDQFSGPDQRNDMAKTIQGVGNRARQFREENQSLADNNYTDAVARREIGGIRLQTWRDPKTGLAPSGDILRAAMEHDANLSEPGVSDSNTLVSLTNDISSRHMLDPGPLNQAYLQNLITGQDFRDLNGLYDTYRDPAKSRWFDYARDAFDARFRDVENAPSPPPQAAATSVGGPTAAMKLFPSYLMNLDGAVRDQDLKGAQVRDLTNKMLDDAGNLLQGKIVGPPELPATGTTNPTFGGEDATSTQPAEPLEAGTMKNPLPEDTNTSTNTNTHTNVLDSQGNTDQIAGAQGSTEGTQTYAERVTSDGKNILERAEEWVNDSARRVVRDASDLPVIVKRELQGHIFPITKVYGEPKDAVHYLTSDRQPFSAPPSANWQAVYDAGKASGQDRIAALKAIGHYGTYDFQRDEKQNLFYDEYKHAANYAVGVYMKGAGFSREETIQQPAPGRLRRIESSNAGDPDQPKWWTNGWEDADKGNLPKKPE